MKRKLLTTILAVILSLSSTINLTACGGDDGGPHTHDYTTLNYNSDNHWYECSCGDKTSIENHKGGTATVSQKAVCLVCNQEYGESLGHVHTLHLTKVDAKPQSCTEEGNIEYYTCSCDKWFTDNTATSEITDKTSVVIAKDAHKYETLKKTATEHWWECSCGEESGVEEHNGGTATVSQKAVCSVCGQEYGELVNPHTFNQQVVDEKYLKSPATCEEKAKYYYSCECGESGTEYFEHGEKLGHAYGEMVSNGNGRHVQTCANDSSHTLIARCSGGTATCDKKAVCTVCGGEYGSVKPHDFAKFNFCKNCYGVYTDMTKSVVELGIPTLLSYKEKDLRNCAWDTYYYNGKIYRGSGSLDSSKTASIWAYDVEKARWYEEIVTNDVAIERFVEIDGKLVAPGADPTGSWSYGNYYELSENGWRTDTSVPNGIHMFDVIEYDGKVFYGLGSNYNQTPLVYTENGVDYTHVYFYNNGVKLDLSKTAQGENGIRVYELFIYKGELHAYLIYKGVYSIYKFDGTNMVCVNEKPLFGQYSSNYNTWNNGFEIDGVYYIIVGVVYAVTDFADSTAFKKYVLPNNEIVADAVYKDGKYHLLTYEKTAVNGKYKTRIYESETMKEDSFVEVVSFDYEIPPLTFDKVGGDFYVSMGNRYTTSSTKNGMLLKVKAN